MTAIADLQITGADSTARSARAPGVSQSRLCRRIVRARSAARRDQVLHHPARSDQGRKSSNDMVAAQYRLVTEGLGIHHLRLVTGNSMGGMQTWMWGVAYPDFMDALAPMASQPTEMASRNWMMRRMIIDAIRKAGGASCSTHWKRYPGKTLAALLAINSARNPRKRGEGARHRLSPRPARAGRGWPSRSDGRVRGSLRARFTAPPPRRPRRSLRLLARCRRRRRRRRRDCRCGTAAPRLGP